jgi:hypothetical protein
MDRRTPLTALALLLTCLAAGCATPEAKIFAPLGKPATRKLTLETGPYCFHTEVGSYSFDGACKILVSVEVLRRSKVIARLTDCRGYSFSHFKTSGSRNGGHQYTAECALTVPAPGGDQIKVSTRLDAGTATVKGLYVQVYAGEGWLCGTF